MTFLVPFDGTLLAEAALVRAAEYGNALDENVVIVSVVPDDEAYATQKGWTTGSAAFDAEVVGAELEARGRKIVPDAEFRHEVTSKADIEAILSEIQRVIAEVTPSVVFLGTENVGRVAGPVSSVSTRERSDATYDVHIVRHRSPTDVQQIDPLAEFYPSIR